MEMFVQLKTSKFEDCKKEPISFDQDSVKTCDCYFFVPQKQPFTGKQLCQSLFLNKVANLEIEAYRDAKAAYEIAGALKSSTKTVVNDF